MTRLRVALTLLLLALLALTAHAQTAPDPGNQPQSTAANPDPTPPPADPLGRDTPRGTADGFLAAIDNDDYALAAQYLDLDLAQFFLGDEHDPEELAEKLGVILIRSDTFKLSDLSTSPEGDPTDLLPRRRDVLVSPGGKHRPILLERVRTVDGDIWLVSGNNVLNIDDIHKDFAYLQWIQAVADAFPDFRIMGLELFKWFLSLASMIACFFVLRLLAIPTAALIFRKSHDNRRRLRRLLGGPLAAIIAIRLSIAVVEYLGVGLQFAEVLRAGTFFIIAITWLLLSLVSIAADIVRSQLRSRGREAAAVLIRPPATGLRVLIIVTALVFWLDNMGFNVTTLITGLGIGGVAIALAVQKPLEDVFAAITIFAQQRLRVGEFCKIGTTLGTVDDIGLRTTRIRTLADTIITVPNSSVSQSNIESFGARRKIRFLATPHADFASTTDNLRACLAAITTALNDHPKVIEGTPRARLKALDQEGAAFEIHAYLDTLDWADYLAAAEEINLSILEAAASTNIRFTKAIDLAG